MTSSILLIYKFDNIIKEMADLQTSRAKQMDNVSIICRYSGFSVFGGWCFSFFRPDKVKSLNRESLTVIKYVN